MKTITLPETQSRLINALLRVITAPQISWDIAASAGDLIALDLRFDNWFLTVAKSQAEIEELERLLEIVAQVTRRIEDSWLAYESSVEFSESDLRKVVIDSCQLLRNAMGDKISSE